MSRSRNPAPRGQGAARAKQMGLLLDLNPDGGMDDEGNDADLEAELMNLVGSGSGGRSHPKKTDGRAPVGMAEIERMAALCMKDIDDEDIGDDDLEDEDLLAELNDVLEDSEEETHAPTPPACAMSAPKVIVTPHSVAAPPKGATGVESKLLERIQMYSTAIANAKTAGESSKVRRYERGLKTLQSMLTSVKKGKPINEEEIPPPVALGGNPSTPSEVVPAIPEDRPQPVERPPSPYNHKPTNESTPPPAYNAKPQLAPPLNTAVSSITPETPAISPLTPSQPEAQDTELKQAVLSRQREYKLAAIDAKQNGNIDLAKQHYIVAKKMDAILEILDRNEPFDVNLLPHPPGDAGNAATTARQVSSKPVASAPAAAPVASATPAAPTYVNPESLPAPKTVAEALQQRMEIYKSAAEGAKSKGDDRKARMHQRIVKQYQDAIKAHKAGRSVNLSDLPMPPGCPPLQGSEGGEQNFMGVLETAMKIANQNDEGDDDDEDAPTPSAVRPPAQKAKSPAPQVALKLGPKAQQQLDFLLLRRQAFLRAALRSKQMKDMTGATQHLRHAKGLDPMIEAAKSGLPVDIKKVPMAPINEEDFSLSRSRSSPSMSPRSSEQFHALMNLLRKQHDKCQGLCQQFTECGSVVEAFKFEKLMGECMKSIEILRNAYNKGHPVPKCCTEERTFNTIKIYSNLALDEMILYIIKGVNLPAPPGVSPNDLDASVKFEFPFPSAEEAQRDKTSTVKSTNNPEFKEQFKLHINRSHRAFKRVIQSKGIKFEIIHKGSLFKNDRVVGTAQVKLEALENNCDFREFIEVMDGRKATGGKLEVRVKIREPVSGAHLQPVTEKWLVLEPVSSLSPPERQKERAPSPRSKSKNEPSAGSRSSNHHSRSSSPPQYKLHSFSLLNYDKERCERKLAEYRKNRRDPPSDLVQQYKEITHRLQWQKSQLERASPAMLNEYENVLKRFAQGLSDSIKKYSSQGNRDAAKDALGRMKMVEQELESLQRKRTG